MITTDGMWRPTYVLPARLRLAPDDAIGHAEHARVWAKWWLFQARRRGDRPEDIAQHERNVEYYDVVIPRWRAQQETV